MSKYMRFRFDSSRSLANGKSILIYLAFHEDVMIPRSDTPGTVSYVLSARVGSAAKERCEQDTGFVRIERRIDMHVFE